MRVRALLPLAAHLFITTTPKPALFGNPQGFIAICLPTLIIVGFPHWSHAGVLRPVLSITSRVHRFLCLRGLLILARVFLNGALFFLLGFLPKPPNLSFSNWWVVPEPPRHRIG